MNQLKIVNDYWDYYPTFFGITEDEVDFGEFLEELTPLCYSYSVKIYGKEFPARRLSVTFKDEGEIKLSYYDAFPSRSWEESPVVSEIRQKIEAYFGAEFDYCLAHVYRNGGDTIGWHADREALNGVVASVSLGASRKFRFRKITETKGWEEELTLDPGDVVLMKRGCQKRYKHCVPVEKRVTEPRINLTFRQYE